jgi:hypothetical protein
MTSFHRNLPRLQTLLLYLASVALLAMPLLAQSTGSIVGTVKDSTGAVIPGATVTLTNLGTADKRTAVTEGNGSYRFLNLPPANYRLDFELKGFKHLTREPVTVPVERAVLIDAALELGNISETVEVTAETPLMDTQSATLSQVVEAKTVQEMPINGRNVMNLLGLVPGVVPQGSTVGHTINSNQSAGHTNNQAFNNYQIGGGIAGHSSAYLDGAPTIGLGGNSVQLIAMQDAVQEFRVATNNVGVEYGRFGGGVVNMATKSGTNEFHGSAYEYFRNKVLNANDFFANAAGQPRPAFNQNQYGITLGGPLRKDKTFFFFGWERFKAIIGQTQLAFEPTDAERTGDFSADLGASTGVINPCTGQPVLKGQIFDPLTTRTVDGKTCRDPFAGNKIPANRIDFTANVMANVLKYWRSPNTNLPGGNFSNSPTAGGTQQQFNGRVDENLSDRHRLFARFTYWRVNDISMSRQSNLTGGAASNQNTHQAVLGDTYSFSPTLVMENRLSFLRGYYDDNPPSDGFDLSQFGPPWASLNGLVTFRQLPGPTVTGYFGGGSRGWQGMNVLSRNYRDTWALSSNMTKISGRHTIKFGGEVRLMDQSPISMSNSSGIFNFNNDFTSYNGTTTANAAGMAYASFLLGNPTSGTLGTAQMAAQYAWYQGYYLGDAWQVNNKLTLNYGVRWELPGAYAEKHDAATVLLPDKTDPLSSATGLSLKGQLALVNSTDWPDRTTQTQKYNIIVPRIGFAYRLTNSTVVRAGYGISTLPMDLSGGAPSNSPILSASTRMNTSVNNAGLIPLNTLSNPFPAGGVVGTVQQSILLPAGRSYNLAGLEGLSISGPVPGQPYAYMQQWNLNIQRELGAGLILEIGYAGAKGTHMPLGSLGLNQLDSKYFSMGSALTATAATNPLAGKVVSTSSFYKTITQGQLLRPYPQFTNVTNSSNNSGISNYHAMQVRLEKRFGAAGVVQGNYTWSKSMGDLDTTASNLELRTIGAYQDYSNPRAEYSLSASDVPHRLVSSYVLELPIGKGKRFAAGATGLVGGLISGWSINGIVNFQSGFPLSLIAASNTLSNSFGAGAIRPNRVAGCDPVKTGRAQDRYSQWFNTACFQQPGSYSFGNEGRVDPVLRNHGVNNIDLTLGKSTAITERVKLVFKTEFFNLFNRVQFSLKDSTTLGSSTFGVSAAQYNYPRMIQFALRLIF